ncbi:hypothetical protein AB0876_32100 [Mycobacterium sp. NPDC049093]
MPEQAMIFAQVGMLLAGAVCLVWSTTATSPSRRRRRLIATEALWVGAGLLALTNVALTVYRLCTEPIGSTTIGNSVVVIFISIVTAFGVVGLLGSVGFWARLRHRRTAPIEAVRRAPGDGGEWASFVNDLPTNPDAIDLGAPANSLDPLHEFDSPRSIPAATGEENNQ